MENTTLNVSRRGLIAGAAMSAAALGAVSFAGNAGADEADSYTYADTIAWDAEYDVVVVGSGAAGLAAAMSAADNGADVLIVEKAPDGEAGGNSRVCGQKFAYGHGDVEATAAYYGALFADRMVPEDVFDALVNGIANCSDYVSWATGLDSADFMPVIETVNGNNVANRSMCPEYPEFPGSESMSLMSAEDGTHGASYVYNATRGNLEANYMDKVDVWFETPAVQLYQDPMSGAIVGVKVNRGGEERNVRALNGVCMCLGGFENNPQMKQHYLGLYKSMPFGTMYNTGDGITMCQAVGARMWHMTIWEGAALPCSLGMWAPEGSRGSSVGIAAASQSSILVGTNGNRFVNETYIMRHGHFDGGNGIWLNPEYPNTIAMVFDQTHLDELEESGGISDAVKEAMVACQSLAEAAEVIGCPEENLAASIEKFNLFVEQGEDYEFHRDITTMRAFDGGETYYVIMMAPNILNTQGGPERNGNAQVINYAGEPIGHLYSAGEFGGATACMYQGGTNIAECLIFGKIAGASAAAAKEPLPAYTLAPKVESAPAHRGDESDLGVAVDHTEGMSDGELLGVGQGIGGDVPVYVMLDDAGAVASVRVGENAETEGIGSKAIEQLPAQFVGLSTAEEIDAVDGVSGATVTSNALKDAVKMAMGL